MRLDANAKQQDPTGKIGKQVGWLNQNVQLAEKISYSDVVGPLSLIDISKAMKILKDLEARAESIQNPTNYVAAAAKRALSEDGGKGGTRMVGGGRVGVNLSMSSGDVTRKIARQVKWLNDNAGLVEKISYPDVVGPLSAISINEAMQILKDCEERASQIKNPTNYVTSAAKKRTPLYKNAGWGSGASTTSERLSSDTVRKISKQVGWLNQNVQLAEPIVFNEVVEPLSVLDPSKAMAILKDVETKAPEIKNPTAYVASAAYKRLGGSAAGGWGGQSKWPPSGTKISKQIGWLNQNVQLVEPIVYADVVEALSACEESTAMGILKDVETKAADIKNPTSYVLSAARRRSGLAGGGPKRIWAAPESSPTTDEQKELSRKIGLLNHKGGLTEKISFSDVIGPLSSIERDDAEKILQDLADRARTVANPTNYIIAAARNAASGAAPPSKQRRLNPPADIGELPPGKAISTMVGRINNKGVLAERISYTDVKDILEDVGPQSVEKILADLEASSWTVRDPTNYVKAAAERLKSEE